MNATLARILETRTLLSPDGQEIALHSALPAAEGEILQYWLRAHQPRRLLEIGLAYGVSSLFVLDAASAWGIERYDIIDAFQSGQWQGLGARHLAEAGVEAAYTLHEELSETCLPRMLAAGMRFDFAFVDGWHTFDQALLEFYYINRMLETGGIVVFDDMHLPSLQKLLRYLGQYPAYAALPLPPAVSQSLPAKVRTVAGLPPCRLAGLRKIAPDDRDWDWFEDF
ncbi:MAG: hypothetical protein CME59_23280 [Halioglobus sp.]|nr:hypothetical protein [Halioglobus sp.]